MQIKLKEEIAKRLKAARKAAGFKSAKDFAKTRSIPLSTYSQHETGKRSINAELIISYSSQFQVNPSWLLTGDGEPYFEDNQKDKIAIIDREIFSISPKMQEKPNQYHHSDLELLKKILLMAGPFFEDKSIKLSYSELIHHCFEIYDSVSRLTADTEEKDKIINLTLSTLKRRT
jgi:transcriptional regulator with XRE-family HTH domain